MNCLTERNRVRIMDFFEACIVRENQPGLANLLPIGPFCTLDNPTTIIASNTHANAVFDGDPDDTRCSGWGRG